MRLIFRTMVSAMLAFGGLAFFTPDEADARGGFRMSRGPSVNPRYKAHMPKIRTKTYRLGNQKIQGYRNYLKARREAKLASGGYRVRSDGKLVRREWRIGTGRISLSPKPLPRPAAAEAGTIHGQCRDGAKVETENVSWACRNAGGVSWTKQPPRVTGIRDY